MNTKCHRDVKTFNITYKDVLKTSYMFHKPKIDKLIGAKSNIKRRFGDTCNIQKTS